MEGYGTIIKERPKRPIQGNLLSCLLSLIAISDDLYKIIAEELEKKIGKGVKKINRKKIREIINAPEFKGVGLEKGHGSKFPIFVESISLDGSREHATVKVILQLLLHGNRNNKEEAIRRITEGTGLEKFPCSEDVYGIGIEIVLSGDNLPYEINPSPIPLSDGIGLGRRAFFTKKEVWSGIYSPVR